MREGLAVMIFVVVFATYLFARFNEFSARRDRLRVPFEFLPRLVS